jgi:RimJ/RimL family protein N-acetyltransferase
MPVMGSAGGREPLVRLRAQQPGEERPDSSSEWDDWGGAFDPQAVSEVGRLLVEADGVVVGDCTWHAVWYGPTSGCQAWNIGIALVPEARGRGIGSRAQRMLAEYLFATTPVARVEASTDVENLAEQRALEKGGFRREGVQRGAQLRRDGRHDLVCYAMLRSDLLG